MSKRLRFQLSHCSQNVYPGKEVQDSDSTNTDNATNTNSNDVISKTCAEGAPYFPSFSLLSEENYSIRAIVSDDIPSLQQTLRRQCLFTVRSFDGTPALHVATAFNNRSIMKFLIDEGFDVNLTAEAGQFKGLSPLHVASTQGHMSAFNLLADRGADLACTTTSDAVSPWSPKQTLLHLATKRNHGYLCNVIVSMRKELIDCPDQDGLTPLHQACILGHKNLGRLFVRSGCNANVRDKTWLTPLVYAMMRKHISLSKVLAEKTDLTLTYNLGNGKGLTAVHLATMLSETQLTQDLISAGCDPNLSCSSYSVSKWRIEKEALLPLHVASLQGDVRMFDVLKSVTAETVTKTTRVTALTLAVMSGKYQMVRYLLSCGFDPNQAVQVQNVLNYTPLHIAAELGLVDMIEQLLIYKADPNVQTLTRSGVKGSTPLHLACRKQQATSTELLITQLNIILKDSKGMTPLHIASSTGCPETVRALLKMEHQSESAECAGRSSFNNGAFVDLESDDGFLCQNTDKSLQPSRTADKEGRLPIHLAVTKNHIAVLETFLGCGEVIDAVDTSGKHLLHLAAEDVNMFPVLCFLLSQNLDRQAKDHFGFSPLHIAAERNNITAVQALLLPEKTMSSSPTIEDVDLCFLRQCLDAPSDSVDITNGEKQTALHIAARGGNSNLVEGLLFAGADVNASDEAGVTPLHLACSMGNAVVSQLTDAGANPNAICQWPSKQHFSDFTPLHVAVLEKENETVRLLVDRGADVNAQFNGTRSVLNSALHLAISQREWDTVEILINKGCSVNQECKNSHHPFMMLMDYGAPLKTQKLLLRCGADVNCIETTPDRASTPLEKVLCFTPPRSDLRLLLDWSADINMLKPNGCTVLHDTVKYLSSKTNNCTAQLEEFFKLSRALKSSISQSNIKSLDSVADKYVCNFNVVDPNGDTILYTATNGRSHYCLELILKYWDKPTFEKVNGDTILRVAAAKRSSDVVRHLLEAGIEINDPASWMQVVTSSNNEMIVLLEEFSRVSTGKEIRFPLVSDDVHGTVLHYAILHSTDSFFEKVLTLKLVPVDSMDSLGRTPLCLAMMNTQTCKVLSLLSVGASLTEALIYRDSTGKDLIHMTVISYQKLYLSLLVLHCSHINRPVNCYQEEQDLTALHIAAMVGGREIIDVLLRAGSDVNCRTANGKLPSDLALENGHSCLSSYLRDLIKDKI